MTPEIHPLAPEHLPGFLPGPDGSDMLFTIVVWLVIILALVLGNLYLRLHALPERMAHQQKSVQFQLVTVMALIALFTHNNYFWIGALLLAAIQLPDYGTPLNSIAESLRTERRPESQPRPDTEELSDA